LVLSDEWDDAGRRERLRAIAGLDCEVILGTPGGTAGTDGGIRLAPIPVRGDPTDRIDLHWAAATIRRLLAEGRPDLVHIEAEPESHLAGTAATVCKKQAAPYVLFSWQSLPKTLGFLAQRRATRVLAHASGVIGGNKLAMALLHERAPGAIAAAIPPAGISLPPQAPARDSAELVIGFAGRLVPERGADLLISALGRTYGKWRLVIAGTGPDQEALEESIEQFGLASRVSWLGGLRAESIEALCSEIDCLVVPSRDTPAWVDHHSSILIEAMGRGIAAIVTRAGALPELVGSVGPVVDDTEQLTAALQRWVVDPGLCRTAGATARSWVLDRYLTSVVAERTVEFWRAVAATVVVKA
jgi:glycosyltransferase involved in cell wall biosynthesis